MPNKIMFVSPGLSVGGAEMMLLKLLSRIDRSRFDAVVVSLTDVGAVGRSIGDLGFHVVGLGLSPGRLSLTGLLALRKIIKAEQPDLIQGWMYHGNLAAQLTGCFIRNCPPMAWSIRGTHTDLTREKDLTALTIWVGAKLSNRPAAIIYNSAFSAKAHWRSLNYSNKREVVIPNGFDTTLFASSCKARARVRAELGAGENFVLVGLVARYHPVKDHVTFAEALARARSAYPEVRGVLIGDGTSPANPDLNALLTRTGTRDYIYCLGERSDLPELTAALDIACNSSVSEGFPNAVGEAMACAVPCVVTDVGDSGWIVSDTGRVVPASSPGLFSTALTDLVQLGAHGRKVLGERARQRILEKFSLDAVVQRYEQTYKAILSRGFD